jgi:hypothetical protein
MNFPIVGLSGGLGNQLFQLARGLALSDQVVLDIETGGKEGRNPVDLLELNLPDQIHIGKFSRLKLLRRIYNGLLGSSTSGHGFAPLISFSYRYFFKLIYLVVNNRIINVLSSKGLGFHETNVPHTPYLVGYFQSYRWAESTKVLKLLHELSPKQKSDELQNAIDEIKASSAIALHVRLGDYLQEKDFGNLSENYYLNALNQIDSDWTNRDIWVFSDDINLSKIKLFNLADRGKSVKWIESINNSTVETWFLMRHASDFVIANSTFSWWAAFLRFNQKGIVCAPEPWFKGIDSPAEIIPMSWLREKSFTKNDLQEF